VHETQGSHVIQIDELTRVEGQGAFYVRLAGDRVAETRFKIFEPPRFFEAFLQGRDAREVPDITARICGICPVAYQMSSCHALETIFEALPEADGPIARLRRLFYCGEWVESHSLHVFFLHLPDYFGLGSAIEVAERHPEIIEHGIQIRKAGNAILVALGGRPMHPVGACVGGWHRAPRRSELLALKPSLVEALERATAAALWMRQRLSPPAFEQPYEFVALKGPGEYPFNRGRLASSAGWEEEMGAWPERFEESQVPYSNAYQARVRATGGSYLTGPLARFNLNRSFLTPRASALAESLGLPLIVRNPYLSILVRMVEIAFCFEEALAIIESYQPPAVPAAPLRLKAGRAAWITEAPRGSLYHHYETREDGSIARATIIPPTSQNQARIEEDLCALVEGRAGDDDHALAHACEFMIRNYDPCISCSTHFLSFRIDR